jgi:methionyl-tRNA synthetase
MVSGSDEHGTPTEVEAIKRGITPKQLTDENHAKIVDLLRRWELSFDNYTRTENPVHLEFVRQHLMRIYERGFIFTQETQMLYCESCKRFLPDRYVEGTCPFCGYEKARGDQCEECGRLLEPTLLVKPYCAICRSKPIIKSTIHWYFDLPKFSKQIGDYLESNEQLPDNAKNFSLNLIKEGLKPRAVTRDVTWGIPAPFPGAENKSIYVWVEAVLGYVSATIEYFKKIGEPNRWREYWFDKKAKTFYCIGKDNIPFHTIIFPALLMASGEDYDLPWNITTTEFLQFKGEKFSKSHRIGVESDEALELFSADYWRYYLMSTRPETKDSDFSWKLFIEKVNGDLNDTFGNFIHRTLTFIHTSFNGEIPKLTLPDQDAEQTLRAVEEKKNKISSEIETCKLQSAANLVTSISRIGNQYLNEKEPWKLIKKDPEKAANILNITSQIVKTLAIVSAPFMPTASDEIWKTLNLSNTIQDWDEAAKPIKAGHKIAKPKPLFKKIEGDEEELQRRLDNVRMHMPKKF